MGERGDRQGEMKPRQGEMKLRQGEMKLRQGEMKLRQGEMKLRQGEMKLRQGEMKLRQGEMKPRQTPSEWDQYRISLIHPPPPPIHPSLFLLHFSLSLFLSSCLFPPNLEKLYIVHPSVHYSFIYLLAELF
ncbi:hypothetical protein J4Q44_G00230590 [Coregonus suidteri]|uniref:Uncharacterized protein n=1 Tax=Coregonus suidteri TaxID=861788 RepID=A0AAN8LBU5_9TELE